MHGIVLSVCYDLAAVDVGPSLLLFQLFHLKLLTTERTLCILIFKFIQEKVVLSLISL